MDLGSIMAGQSAGLVKTVRPVQEIILDIYEHSRYGKGEIR